MIKITFPGVVAALAGGVLCVHTAQGSPIYNNLTPSNLIAVATRPSASGQFEIETGDDFILASPTIINLASFTGLITLPNGAATISSVDIEIYRVFPLDSDTVRMIKVPTRANSPSDNALDSRSSPAGLTFSSSTLNTNFTANNSVQAGGIHPAPNQTTQGNGSINGQEVQIDVTFTTPFLLNPDHYFFVPQVTLSNGAQFYWLSASRPITGAGTTNISPDLQAWTRDANLDPDWLRIGTDIVGGTTPPTYNMAYSLDGIVLPEPATWALLAVGLGLVMISRIRTQHRR